ncbi:MAG: ABC transporter ATP-binding protein [Phycisphaerae bacterium]
MNQAQSQGMALLELMDVVKHYDSVGGAGAPAVLKGVSLRVEAGRSLAIVGPSGCGKSTLLNIMGALDRPTSGKVLLDGADLGAMDDSSLAAIRNRRIGFVFQLHHLLPQLTVLENVLVPTLVGPAASDVADKARRLLARVGLAERETYRPGQLSGGEQQRAAVVRALINSPELLLCDEPTGALDRASAENLAQLLAELNREEGVTLIVVTHSTDLAQRMNAIYELRDGSLSPKTVAAGQKA